jgi:hypothetical protein
MTPPAKAGSPLPSTLMGVLPGAGTFYFEGSDVGCLLIHEATLDFDLERIGLEWLGFVRKHSRVLTPA